MARSKPYRQRDFGFVHISPTFLLLTAIIVGLYVLGAELAKRLFYKREGL